MSFIHKRLGSENSFGADLRELRQLRGLTTEELAALTRIHVSVIQALEDEELKNLKDPIYAERHVRMLAEVLEVGPGFLLKKYRQLLKSKQALNPSLLTVHPTTSWRDFFVPSRLIRLSGFFLLIALAAAYLFWQARVLQEPPPLNLSAPVDGLVVALPYVDIKGVTAPNSTVTINGLNAIVDRAGNFNLQYDLPRGVTTLRIEARRRYGDPVTKSLRVTYERPAEENSKHQAPNFK